MARIYPVFGSIITLLVYVLLVVTLVEASPTEANVLFQSTDDSGSFSHLLLKEKRDELIKTYRPKITFQVELVRGGHLVEVTYARIFGLSEYDGGIQEVIFEGDTPSENKDATLKEFFSLFSNDLMHPRYHMFHSGGSHGKKHISYGRARQVDRFPHQSAHTARFQPPLLDKNYLKSLICVGRVIATAILNNQFMDVTFDSDLYKMILGKKIHKFDISVFEKPDNFIYYARCEKKLGYYPYAEDDDASNGFQLTFTDPSIIQDMVLMIDGFRTSVSNFPMTVVCQGIFEYIPQEAFAVFNEQELQTLISGKAPPRGMDSHFWQKFTKNLILSADHHQTVNWFWDCVDSFDDDMQSRLLSFVTGNYRFPIGVLNDADSSKLLSSWIKIQWSGKEDAPPTSDPYTNTLYLSSYTSYKTLRSQLESVLKTFSGAPAWFVSAVQLRGQTLKSM